MTYRDLKPNVLNTPYDSNTPEKTIELPYDKSF